MAASGVVAVEQGVGEPTTAAAVRRPRLVLAVVCMVILLDALDLSITQVALPAIRADLQVSDLALPWIVNAYVLTYGGLLLFGGRVADLLGRRRALVAGLILFGAGSLTCAVAPDHLVDHRAPSRDGCGADGAGCGGDHRRHLRAGPA